MKERILKGFTFVTFVTFVVDLAKRRNKHG